MGSRYMAYMLRLWQEGNRDGAVWRASLEDAHTAERHVFASRQELLAFLDALMSAPFCSESMTTGNELPSDAD